MKIIYWTESFLPDISGVGILGQNLLPELQKKGFDFTIITSHGKYKLPDIDYFNDIKIYRFPFHSTLINNDFNGIKDIVNKLNNINKKIMPDVVHLNSSEPSLFYYMHSMIKHVPSLVTIHLFINEIHTNIGLFSRVLKNSDWITTVSKETLLSIQKLYPEVTLRSSHIENAIKTPNIQPTNIPNNPYKILFLGRLAKEKGADIVIQAFSRIIKVFNKATLIISGDGPELQNLKKLTLKYELSEFVNFTGEVSPMDIPNLLNTVSLVIIPSTSEEQSPMIALQAGMMERPVIASDVGGLREVIQDNITGLLFKKEDSKDLTDKILYLIRNPTIAQMLGKSARQRVTTVYDLDKCVNEYEKIYQQLINGNNSSI